LVDDVSITNFKFSDSFAKAIEEKQVAQQNAERAKFNLEAAQTDAQAQAAQAQTLSDAYLKKLAIEKWDGKMPTAMGGEGSLFNIPLR
jgi:regulator of protease activity HflC (stomatin/prohibitin superfamily)